MKIGDRVTRMGDGGYGPSSVFFKGDKGTIALTIDLDTDPEGEADAYDNVTRIRITRVLTLQEGRDFIKAIAPIMKSTVVA